MNKIQLYDAIQNEWSNIHHNASISGHYPDFQNDYEADLFWSYLEDDVSFWIEDLQQVIKEKFGYDWKFYSYGRNGATIAPSDIMRSASCNDFGSLKEEAIPEDYQEMRKFHKALMYINSYWEATAQDIKTWWKETKEANEYQEDINEHDGTHAVMKQVWISNN